MKKYVIPFLALSLLFSCKTSTDTNSTEMKLDKNNPFAQESKLPYYAPDFSKIKDEDFKPAFEEGMRIQLAEIEQIATNSEEPTFENTIVAMEKTGELLERVELVFSLLSSANTNDYLQELQEEMAAKGAEHSDKIHLNSALFQRIKKVYDQRTSLKLDVESAKLLDYYYQSFVMAGANLSDADKGKLKEINKELATLSAQFTNKLLDAANSGALIVTDKSELDGLSEGKIASFKKDGKYVLPLQNTTQQPALQTMNNRETRKKLFDASWNRNQLGDKNDTREIVLKLAKIRAEKAKLLGFENFAAWKIQDQMAKNPETVNQFFTQFAPAAVAKAKEEAEDIQKMIAKKGGDFQLEAYDWDHYAEMVRKEKYDLDEEAIKPYFVLDSVLINGVFYAATQLYGITFKERIDLPVYNEDVRVFELFEKDGSQLGLFYGDFFKRSNKSGGAWMSNLVNQSYLKNRKPVIYNVCNFTKPAEGQPALISFDDVITMFHEFGHALHGFFADQQYPSLSGTATARDFVEFPSQINENWALYPSVLKNYAKHYATGEAIPQALLDKIKKASTFNQGYALTELAAAAALDMQWHELTTADQVTDVDKFETEVLKKVGLYVEEVPTRYRSSYFLHIWSNGYSAGYYAYLWTEMLDHDAYQWFEENGGMSLENGQRFRDMILSRGNTEDLAEMYKKFRGAEPKIEPMLKARGL